MPTLDLTEHQAELLRELAEDWLSDLRMEIASTDRQDFREALKWKESLLHEVLERLASAVKVPARR